MSTETPEISVEPDLKSQQYSGRADAHTDAAAMRRRLGIPEFDPDNWSWSVIPDLLDHTWSAGPDQSAGGTDLLATGPPGTGKSTLALGLSERLLEINQETVVWRGSPSRSEWTPFAPWAKVCIPERVGISAKLVPKDPTREEIEVDLEDMAREVETYQNPIHLNKQVLEPGKFHVVYPDPRMFDCQEILADAARGGYEGLEFREEDPLNHWWFAWVLARVEEGPHHWTTLVADEIGDIAPESARSDEFATYEKIQLLRDTWVDARKYGLTILAFGHSERDIHNLIRHKIRWRASMNGRGNPTAKSEVIGFNSVPMNSDLSSRMDLGECLVFTEQHFDKLAWSDVPDPLGSYSLKVKMGGA